MREATGARWLVGLAGNPSVSLLLAVGLVLGLGNCAPRAPAASSVENSANGESRQESAARLQNCSTGSADCDANPANACEAALANDPKNCGACGVRCAAANGESSCVAGTCRMVYCIP